ncbi:inositol 1,4,5-trisphosphate receptor-interacting protein [Scleropages formosus]|uniref:Inositol 1,4,5-trisphosphate receptor-interacting protein n=1 Tax=Scleropages formosus TaxID=113540 RepID=A0A8C9TQS6_SCLFO|nr:inositol 1,4,5-trisphosphate receptor-interacting protein-like [Scleropages formosus]XP_029107279.1 inositol 1,4,5-trisphosphate receptor-interacting protein-like [Scleropages formosus]XP_029107280.1 inositol 1,4,5-trisphosphate receptor-interacting protein-like [Scleropages formosus]
MQGAIVRLCVVVAAAIINHPLLFPKDNSSVEEQDSELLARMREHEEKLQEERRQLEAELEAQPEPPREETSYGWYLWSALSLVAFLTIEMCRLEFGDPDARALDREERDAPCGTALFPHEGPLAAFYERCVRVSAHESRRVQEFVEGFADDLLEAWRSVCDRDADMEVGDCVGVGSMHEGWRASRPLVCDLVVPFAPPEPFRFAFELWCAGARLPPDMQGCGRIEVVRAAEDGAGCLCGSAELGEDMLCLLHGRSERPLVQELSGDLLCSKDTAYLATDQVMKWFQISITKAWARISHKYDFDLTFRNLDSPGALKVRLRSGKVVVLNITPVVQLEDTDAYFVSQLPSESQSRCDTCWPLSFAVYEKNLLKYLAKELPENSCHLQCLQIACFLHKKQTDLTGRSALTTYHLKTALLHLLLARHRVDWAPTSLAARLRDLLCFLESSLQEKRLYHVLVGNPQVPRGFPLPAVFRLAEPINLLRPLVLQRRNYASMVEHFREMLRNAPVLVEEYAAQLNSAGLS